MARKTTATGGKAVHPALYSWREQLPATFVRLLAYLGGIAVLSVAAARIFGPAPATPTQPLLQSKWIDIEKTFPAFALSIPEAADMPSNYAIRRNAAGDGRKDILNLGEPTGDAPFLQVTIYRLGSEMAGFPLPQSDLVAQAASVGPVTAFRTEQPLASKFGALSVAAFDVGIPPRHCLGFLRDFNEPRLQLSGRFCQGGAEYIRTLHACLCARPPDIVVRRQRAEDRRLVCEGRAQARLLRPARSHPDADAEIQIALEGARRPPRAAPHRSLDGLPHTSQTSCDAPARPVS